MSPGLDVHSVALAEGKGHSLICCPCAPLGVGVGADLISDLIFGGAGEPAIDGTDTGGRAVCGGGELYDRYLRRRSCVVATVGADVLNGVRGKLI